MNMIIKIDTREQTPYEFKNPSEVGTIPIGDYSISGLENHIAIERKKINDLINKSSKDFTNFYKHFTNAKAQNR